VGTALSETSGIKYMSPSKLKRGRIATQTNFRKFMENCRASLNQQYADTEADWTAVYAWLTALQSSDTR
jgi:hypothetical protein